MLESDRGREGVINAGGLLNWSLDQSDWCRVVCAYMQGERD